MSVPQPASNTTRDLDRKLMGFSTRKFLGFAVRTLVASLALSALAVLVLRWVPPPTSSFILQRQAKAFLAGDALSSVRHRWVPWEGLSPNLCIAVVAAEDQKFPSHWGFDLEALADAVGEARRGTRRMRGASTITQQTAKNLFLWPGRSWVRKGLEAYATVLLEALWPKRRILEVYLNVAQFGDRIFGAEAASRAFFGRSASRLDPVEASILAAVLPNPVRLRADAPSSYVLERAGWIRQQVAQLGGSAYLSGLR
jgi:monofunctional biosynthetic peptidoglycan transglycosylase